MLTFGDLLRRHRLSAGLSQEALAERAGLSLRGISDLERSARRAPYRDTILRLAEALSLGEPDRAALLAAGGRQRAGRRVALPEPATGIVPASPSSFVGRQSELEELVRLLRTRRLLTLTGAGGVGKTRLAVRVAAAVATDHPDGVWFIDLAPLAAGELVPRAFAAALGVNEQPTRPVTDTLTDALAGRRMLCLLDNCEHVVDACAALAHRLLRRCGELTILATSREPLRVDGETAWSVPPLRVPNHTLAREQLEHIEAVQLFADRAQAVHPAFRLNERNAAAVADICRRLDGMPLAIELAAARVKVLPPEQLAQRLDDRFRLLTHGARTAPSRQQTLWAAVQWSYDLLSESERRLFASLTVFAGGWSLEAAEAVCTADNEQAAHVFELLGGLVDKSLVQVDDAAGERRFHLLETLREYGREHLTDGDRAPARDRHVEFFLRLAETAEPELWGAEAMTWLERLEQEHDNLRTALTWCLDRGCAEQGLRLGAAATGFWVARGHLSEGREWLRRLLLLPEDPVHAMARAAAVTGAARLASYQGDDVAARALAQEAIARFRTLGVEGRQLALAHAILAYTLRRYAEVHPAHAAAEQGIAVSRAINDRALEALNRLHLGRALHAQGHTDQAYAEYRAVLALARETGFTRTHVRALCSLGLLSHEQGNIGAAHISLQESLTHARAMADTYEMAGALVALGRLAADLGDAAMARQHLAEGVMLGRELGNREVLATCLGGLARLLSVQGRTHQALQLVGAVQACYASQSLPTPPEVQDDVSRALTAARTTLDEAEEESILAVGRALGLDQAIVLGLEQGRSSKPAVAVAACAPPAGSGPQALRPARHGRYLRPSRTN